MDEQSAPIAIDEDIAWLSEQIAMLKDLGHQNEVSDGEIYDFSIRWGTALAGRLPRLLYYRSRGMLDEASGQRVAVVCEEMRRLRALIDHFGLTQPVFDAMSWPESTPTTSPRGRLFRRG